eukprot:62594_1
MEDEKDDCKTQPVTEPQFNLRCISSWNVWGVPFASSKIFHRVKKWRPFNDECLLKTITQNQQNTPINTQKDLIISCFQECWSFHNGPFMNYFSTTDESNWAFWKERFLLICAVFTYPFICAFKCVYDAQARMLHNQDNEHRYIPFKYVSGSHGMSLRRARMIDSGLCILSTWKPKHHEFIAFEHTPAIPHEEMLANKGILWAYYVNPQGTCGTVVINTHLSTNTETQYLQMEELKIHFKELCDELMDRTKHFEIYMTGDFNSEYHEPHLYHLQKSLKLRHISTMRMTNGPQNRCIDHIFLWRKNENEYLTQRTKCIQSEVIKPWNNQCVQCPKTTDCLSDHCWQAIIVHGMNGTGFYVRQHEKLRSDVEYLKIL